MEYSKAVLDPLTRITTGGFNMSEIFRDWLSLCLYTLERNDEPYLKVLARYRKEDATHFSEAFGGLMSASAEKNHDVLGGIYMDIASRFSAKSMGQFFTPIPMSDMMAQINVPDEPDKPASVLDPACGSGRLLLSGAKRLHPKSFFCGIDLDQTCAKMAALNFCLFNMNGVVLWGNGLSMEYYGGWHTWRTGLGGSIRAMTEAEVDKASRHIEEGLQDPENEQLTLFAQEATS